MGVDESMIAEFAELCEKYKKADDKILVLQASAAEGLRKIGVGCITSESREEFVSLEEEITGILARMRKICETLH